MTTEPLSGRTALVTGASRGIGAGIALELARAGADVAINYNASAEAAREVAAAVRALGRRAETYQADVMDPQACASLAQRAVAGFGSIDILVNNAGFGGRRPGLSLLMDIDEADIMDQLRVHTLAPFHLCKALVPQMRPLGRGDVVMISSESVRFRGPGRGAYSIAKAGMEMLAATLAKEEKKHGIRVNTVSPGFVETDMAVGFYRNQGRDIKDAYAESPFGFMCQPEDIGRAVVYLCGESGRYLTNTTIVVSGDRFSL